MNFQSLIVVQKADKYLDDAFARAKAHAVEQRSDLRSSKLSELERTKRTDLNRASVIYKALISSFEQIITGFPRFDSLPAFYYDLCRCSFDVDESKRSLGAVLWVRNKIESLQREFVYDIKGSRDELALGKHRRSFYGRVSSVVKQINTELKILEETRKTMKAFPSIKTSVPTVVIAGMPNVGKSTLLKALTGANPKTASYPFTTQRLLLGYDDKKIQYIDTPGLLDRPFKDRNPIERQAILAFKHVASFYIFIVDPTLACGYDLKQQQSLYDELAELFPIKNVIVINKADEATAEDIKSAQKAFKKALLISAEKKDVEELVKIIREQLLQEQ